MPRTGLKIAEKLEGERLYTDVARVEFERSLVEPVFYVPREVYLVKGAAPAVGWVNRYGDYYLSRVLDKSLTPEQCWDASYKQETRPVNECVAQFLELARTPDSKHEAFLKFAEEWGVLGIWPRIYVDDNDNYAWRYRESIAMWRRFARQYYALYRVGAKLVQGQLAKREDWKSAVDQRSLHYYRVDGEAFQTDVVAQRRVLAKAVSDLLRHVNTHPVLVWGARDIPQVRLSTEYLSQQWDRDFITRQDRALASMERQTGIPIIGNRELEEEYVGKEPNLANPYDVIELGPYRPSTLFNVLILQLAATLASADGYLQCVQCGNDFQLAPNTKVRLVPLCSQKCREKRNREKTKENKRAKAVADQETLREN